MHLTARTVKWFGDADAVYSPDYYFHESATAPPALPQPLAKIARSHNRTDNMFITPADVPGFLKTLPLAKNSVRESFRRQTGKIWGLRTCGIF